MRLFFPLSGDDVFISYSRRDGALYAAGLADKLTEKKLSCFIDKLGTEPNHDLPPSLRKKIKSCSVFVLIGTEKAAQSEFVQKEIAEFKQTGRTILPIDFNGSVGKSIWYEEIPGLAVETEKDLEALETGNPSQNVTSFIEKSFNYTRRNQFMSRMFLGAMSVFIVLVGLGIGAFLYAQNQLNNAEVASQKANEQEARAIDASNLANKRTRDAELASNRANTESNRADSEANRAKEQQQIANSKTIEANKATKLAENAKLEAREATEEVKRKTEENDLLTEKNSGLITQTENLRKEITDLSTQSKMLQIRIAAQNQVAEDPLAAYKLAVEAYKLKPDTANRKLILSSLSKIDLFYRYQTKEYSIEDFKEPFILLSRKGRGDEGNDLLVFNVNSLETQSVYAKADRAWVIPTGTTWRLLIMNWKGSGLDANTVYQLWGNDGKTLSDEIEGGKLLQIKFHNNGKVSFPLYKDSKILVWDLVSNNKQFITHDTSGGFDNYFYNIYGALDTRSDGVSAAHYRDGLVLVGTDGKIQVGSYTKVDFDPSAFFSAAKWSPDDRYLALNYFDRKRLGIWNSAEKYFIWLDPDGWIIESYSWSLDGHLLAFSGRTENATDVTVEVVDARSPEESRKIIYKGDVPIRSVTFLPGDEQLAVADREGNISIIQISNGEILRTGRQADVNKLFSTQNAFYSSSPNLFRVWSTKPAPSKHWLFQSTKSRVYQATAAADPKWNWLAVAFVENKTRGGIELRKIQTGGKLELRIPGPESIKLEFSENGQWLVLETSKNLRIYNTNSWTYYDFTLQQDDNQFIGMKILGDIVQARAQGKDWINNLAEGYNYNIKLNEPQPTFIDRIYSAKDENDSPDKDTLLKEIDGWEFGKLYKYRSGGILSSPNSGWAHYVKCRDQALGASDCDVQFLPRNLEKIMNLYDSLLWKPTDEELKTWLP